MSLVVLDTDVSSQIPRDQLLEDMRRSLDGHEWAVSFVTTGELTNLVRTAFVGSTSP